MKRLFMLLTILSVLIVGCVNGSDNEDAADTVFALDDEQRETLSEIVDIYKRALNNDDLPSKDETELIANYLKSHAEDKDNGAAITVMMMSKAYLDHIYVMLNEDAPRENEHRESFLKHLANLEAIVQ